MAEHAFADEYKERCYLVAAAIFPSADLARARRTIGRLVLPGQRRIHFANERDSRRRQIVNVIVDLAPEVIIYDASAHRGDHARRAACLTQAVADLIKRQAELFVLERDDTSLEGDKRLLYRELRAAEQGDNLRYRHLRAHEEPLLAVPDAMAWCWAKGSHWQIGRASCRERV